jgi:hypothetical protein
MLRRAAGFISLCLVLTSVLAGETSPDKPIQASAISIKGSATLKDAIKSLNSSGNVVVDLRSKFGQEETNPTLQLNLEKAPFWQAADTIAAKAGVRLRSWMNPETKQTALGIFALGPINDRMPNVRPVYDGPFRMAVKRLTADRNLEDDSLSNLAVMLELTWEPRLQPLLLRLRQDSVRAANDKSELTSVDQGGSGVIRLLGEPAVEMPLRLPLPARDKKVLPKLECQFQILVPMERLRYEFKNIVRGEKQTEKGVTVQVNRFETEPSGLWTIGLTLQYPPKSLDLESHQTWALDGNELTLVYANGQRFTSKVNRDVSIEDGGAMRVTYYFERMAGKPEEYHLEYRAPAAPLTYPVKFTFVDLPLP